MLKRHWYLMPLLLGMLAASQASAQSFSGFLRSLSNSISGGSNQPAPAPNTSATATIGVRGAEPVGDAVNRATPAPEDVKTLDGWSATRNDAEGDAAKRKLSARSVSYKSTDARSAGQGDGQ